MAQAWTSSITSIMSPQGDFLPPGIIQAVGQEDKLSVSITFSKPLSDTSVSLSSFFVIDNGLQVFSAILADDKRVVFLTTSPQMIGVLYTITVNSLGGVTDRLGNSIDSSDAQTTFFPKRPRGYEINVPRDEWSNFVPSLKLDIPPYASYGTSNPVYSMDNRYYIPSFFSRIAYYIELESNVTSELSYLWVSMDSFTTDASSIGVPTGQAFDRPVSNMNVFSSVQSINTGSNLPGGYIEFYSTNYAEGSDNSFNHDDIKSSNGEYGAMQIHQGSDVSRKETVSLFSVLSVQELTLMNHYSS